MKGYWEHLNWNIKNSIIFLISAIAWWFNSRFFGRLSKVIDYLLFSLVNATSFLRLPCLLYFYATLLSWSVGWELLIFTKNNVCFFVHMRTCWGECKIIAPRTQWHKVFPLTVSMWKAPCSIFSFTVSGVLFEIDRFRKPCFWVVVVGTVYWIWPFLISIFHFFSSKPKLIKRLVKYIISILGKFLLSHRGLAWDEIHKMKNLQGKFL